jgi:hypothetical protein
MQNDRNKRVSAFAKLLVVNDRQVLVALQRVSDERLAVILQVWVGGDEDHQLRAQIETKDDASAQEAFDRISGENIGLLLDDVGITDVIRDLEIVRG